MLRDLVHQLLNISTDQIVWQDYVVALVGVALFLMLIPVLRSIFFNIRRQKSARIAKTASRLMGVTLAAAWAGIVLDVFGYTMTLAIILPVVTLMLIGNGVYVMLARES